MAVFVAAAVGGFKRARARVPRFHCVASLASAPPLLLLLPFLEQEGNRVLENVKCARARKCETFPRIWADIGRFFVRLGVFKWLLVRYGS